MNNKKIFLFPILAVVAVLVSMEYGDLNMVIISFLSAMGLTAMALFKILVGE